jgi:DNA-directed RNA polymerase specialized sigma24 family protein
MTASHDSHRSFHTTRWSIVYGAGGQRGAAQSQRALEELCKQYWPPLYAFLRRQGLSPSDSEDTVQGFFALLLRRNDFGGLSPTHGRFRAYLLASLKHYLSNQQDHARAAKRGGGLPIASLDGLSAESFIRTELAHTETAERAYERQWALTMLDRVKIQLIENQHDDRRALCETLVAHITFDPNLPTYAEVARQFTMTEAAVKMTVNRLRKQYRDILRCEIAQTVVSEQEIDDEIQHLISVLTF